MEKISPLSVEAGEMDYTAVQILKNKPTLVEKVM